MLMQKLEWRYVITGFIEIGLNEIVGHCHAQKIIIYHHMEINRIPVF